MQNDEPGQNMMDVDGVGYSTRGLVARMRLNGNAHTEGDITVRLAEAYGFCWGVERAVRMAYEARIAYPDKKIWITNEIIHNPTVNERLSDMGVAFIDADDKGMKDFTVVNEGDVVVLPAFGASVQEMLLLNSKKAQIVDTTCPWVAKVWNAVDTQTRKSHTSIIHGKWAHEETVATTSFASKYVVVKDLKEAQYVADYILHGGNKDDFVKKFTNAISEGFNPDEDLVRVGLANQTTMLKGETQAVGKLLEQTMLTKYGPAKLNDHYLVVDTICDATQERQDAVFDMMKDLDGDDASKKIDLMLVVGGFNSSNTSHLQEIPEVKGLPSFWVDTADRIDAEAGVIHSRTFKGEMITTKNWLPDGPLKIGITSGGSTTTKAIEDVLDAVFRTRNKGFQGVPMLEKAVNTADAYDELAESEL
jgi:4-hydroxy-3-methylbut-2-en-1-yl diphosphate reductase